MKSKVRCKTSYFDILISPTRPVGDQNIPVGYEWIVDNERAEYLIGLGLVELVERVEAKPVKEEKKLPTKKAVKR